MINNLHVLFFIRLEKLSKKGKAPIYCRITVDKQRVTFSLQRETAPQYWCANRELVNGPETAAETINAFICLIRKKIYDAHYKLVDSNTPISAQEIKELVLNKEKRKSKSLFTVFEQHNSKLKVLIGSSFARGTHCKYATTYKHLQEFVAYKYSRNDFFLHEVNHEFITEFDFFLRSEKKCANNTTVKYIKNLSKILRYALNNSWIEKNPLANYKIKLTKVDRGFLSKEELDLIINKQISIKRLDVVRDVFVFQCFTGLAYCDVERLKQENLSYDDKGVLWLKTKRNKTDTVVNIPLLKDALKIIEKYKDYLGRNDKLLPVPSNQKMNAYLKEIGDICGIEKRLTSHLARHTFATTITLSNGISMESVSKMLGHTNLVTTKIYARMLDSRVLSEMQTLQEKLANNRK